MQAVKSILNTECKLALVESKVFSRRSILALTTIMFIQVTVSTLRNKFQLLTDINSGELAEGLNHG